MTYQAESAAMLKAQVEAQANGNIFWKCTHKIMVKHDQKHLPYFLASDQAIFSGPRSFCPPGPSGRCAIERFFQKEAKGCPQGYRRTLQLVNSNCLDILLEVSISFSGL